MKADLVADALEILQSRLPDSWDVQLEQTEVASPDYRVDALASLSAPDKRLVTIAIEAKARLTPRNAILVCALAESFEGMPFLVVSPFLSKATRERLREAGLNWLDFTGNLRLVLSEPGLFIETQGDERRRGTASRPARTLKGPKAGRAVRALLSVPLPIGARELAQRARIDPGYMSRVLELLDAGALLERERRGPVTRVDKTRLIRKWAEDAPIETRGRTETYFEPRGMKGLVDKLQSTDVKYALTGSLAAQRWAPVAAPRLAQVYVERMNDTANALQLRPADGGGNVQLIRPKDVEILGSAKQENDGLIYAVRAQVVADLLTSPGRGPSEGEALLEWMIDQDDAWA